MVIKNGILIAVLTSMVTAVLSLPCAALTWVRDGKSLATIVIPEQALPVEIYAAQELQYHIQRSTGVKLAIVVEGKVASSGAHIYLGHCKATAGAGVDASSVPGNGYVLKTVGNNLYIAGKDADGSPLSLNVHAGTLFGVYDLLEQQMGVRWLWPGKLGEVIPTRKTLSIPALNATVKPLLLFKEWRGSLPGGKWAQVAQNAESFSSDQSTWARRQRFGRSVSPSYGHSFGEYWDRFGKTHPEYIAMLPDGTRRLDPTCPMYPGPSWALHVCVSQPALWNQIIEDWKTNGAGAFLNVCENDDWADCTCPVCMSWDVPNPTDGIDFGSRLAKAKAGFDARRSTWPVQLGSLSDRYAKFWKIMSDKASKIRPDVTVVSYAYDNYRKPPVSHISLGQNVLVGYVPDVPLPYNAKVSQAFQEEWVGWSNTGCSLFLRPNYTLDGGNFPVIFAHTLGNDLKFALAHSLKGADFDSLTGQYPTQGPTLYMLADVLNHPNASVDGILDDYYSAFGPAKSSVKQYFELCETTYQQVTQDKFKEIERSKRKYRDTNDFTSVAMEIFTPEVVKKAWGLLDNAKQQAAGDTTASARVEWITKGFKQIDLQLAAGRAYEHGVDTGDRTAFNQAWKVLNDFRSQELDPRLFNFSSAEKGEDAIWNRVAGAGGRRGGQ